MDEFPQPPSAKSKSKVKFDGDDAKAERRKQKKQAKLTKPPKPERYRHTPTFAAQSFTMTATPDAFLRNQTHKRSRPTLDLAKKRAPSPNVVQPFDDRSSGEYDRSNLRTPTRDPRKSPGFAPNRFMPPPSPHYELFSNTILHQQAPATMTGRRTPVTGDSVTRGRPDWAEMDEDISRKPLNLKRANSTASTKSSKSHRRPKSQGPDLATVLKGNTVFRISQDEESIYQGRGCTPWRIRV